MFNCQYLVVWLKSFERKPLEVFCSTVTHRASSVIPSFFRDRPLRHLKISLSTEFIYFHDFSWTCTVDSPTSNSTRNLSSSFIKLSKVFNLIFIVLWFIYYLKYIIRVTNTITITMLGNKHLIPGKSTIQLMRTALRIQHA